MTMKIVSAAALAAALLAGPALADVTYFGTAGTVTQSRQQDNAQVAPAPRGDTRTGEGFAARQTFGTPNRNVSSDAARETNADAYLGTAWRYQDTADHVSR